MHIKQVVMLTSYHAAATLNTDTMSRGFKSCLVDSNQVSWI